MRTLRARPILAERGRTIVAVEAVDSVHARTRRGGRLHATVRPTAVVVVSAAGSQALDMDGAPIDLDRLRRSSPALDAELERMIGRGTGADESSR